MSTDYNTDDSQENSSGQDQTEGGGESGGEENNEADMIFAPEASKPGRNAGMLMVAFVMIGVGVIYFMRARGGPARAVASAEVQKADQLIEGFTKDRDQIKKMKDMLNSTQKVVEQFSTYSETKQVSAEELKGKDPFTYVSPNGTRPGEDPEKVAAAKAAAEKAKRKARFSEDLQNLKLQYIIVSSTMKSAMVNNKLVKGSQ